MKNKLLILLLVILGMAGHSMAQTSSSDAANRIGIVGSWKKMLFYGRTDGKQFNYELDGTSLYIINSNGTAQYTTNKNKIANAKWTLTDKVFHIWGADKLNDPEGIDYSFILVMVTPEKLVLKMEEDEDNYVFTEFRKSKGTLKQIGTTLQSMTQESSVSSKPVGYKFTENIFDYEVIGPKEVKVGIAERNRVGTSLNIPSTVKHEEVLYNITTIGASSMQMLEITSLTIPATIKIIESMAFWACHKLKTISIPSSTTVIDPSAFDNCESLISIQVDARNPKYSVVDNVLMTKDRKCLMRYPACRLGEDYVVPSSVEVIAECAFENCKLRSVIIPAKTTSIPASAFSDCENLSIINISADNPVYYAPENVLMTKNGKTLLRYPAGKLDRSYVVPSSVENIQWGAFSSCRLEGIQINNERIIVDKYAFRDSYNLKIVQLPSNVVSTLQEKTFSNCDKLEKIYVKMPDGDIRSISAGPYK